MKKEALDVARPKVPDLKNPKMKKEVLDVEMKDEKGDVDKETSKEDLDLLTLEDIKEQIKHIEKAVSTKEPRFMSRALRAIVGIRKKLNGNVIRKAVQFYFAASATSMPAGPSGIIEFLDEPLDLEVPAIGRPKSRSQQLLPEVEIYLHLLLLLYLIDQNKKQDAMRCSDALTEKVVGHNRRTLDMLAAKCYYYHARVYEILNQVEKLRGFLHSRLRTCTLRSDYEGTATLLNLLLRNYLIFNLYDQADKLVSKSTFPVTASNNEWARYLYYLGKIKAIQLEYSEAHKNLLQAFRKAPQHTAIGFKQAVQKMLVLVELLLGDIPERSVFRQATMRKPLQPYFQLTQAVRTGNLSLFNETLDKYEPQFYAEGTYTLIIRLRHNVIKTGIRMINLSYSRISLVDVAKKLLLDSPEDAEFIVAKAIRDGVIEATINHDKGYVQSKENIDVYSTKEPMSAFHQRITFCLDIHNSSIKAMRFPPKSYNKDLESAEERREREQQEIESAKEIADEDFDGFP